MAGLVETGMGWHISKLQGMASALNWERLLPRAGLVRSSDVLQPSADIAPIDIYCYVCNDAKLDPDLAAHLATFGINVQALTKTEKSMTELVAQPSLTLPCRRLILT
jgi:hypothetical protein